MQLQRIERENHDGSGALLLGKSEEGVPVGPAGASVGVSVVGRTVGPSVGIDGAPVSVGFSEGAALDLAMGVSVGNSAVGVGLLVGGSAVSGAVGD